MKMTVIEVVIDDIVVDDKYYSFQYKVKVNGIERASAEYQNDHAWGTDHKGFIAMLEAGEAVKLALEEVL